MAHRQAENPVERADGRDRTKNPGHHQLVGQILAPRLDAEAFAETIRVLGEGNAFVDDDELDFAIHQGRLYFVVGKPPEPLTVRAIIQLMGKIWRTSTALSAPEWAFLVDFAAAVDRGAFMQDRFLQAAVEGGETLKTYTHRDADADEDAGWFGLHRFFGMYVVNWTQYGEGQDEYGPFAKKKDAKAVFDNKIALNT